jgi:DNA-binding protein YbaB
LIIEDSLAKNWLQGQLKIHQQIFDHSFNTEIVKVSVAGLFQVLDSVFDKEEIEKFKQDYELVKNKKASADRIAAFKGIAKKFAEGAAKSAGAGVVKVLKAHLGMY